MIELVLDLSHQLDTKGPTFDQYADFLEEMKGDQNMSMCSHECGVDAGAEFNSIEEKDAYVAKVIKYVKTKLGPGITVTEWPFPDGYEMWNANQN